MGLCTLQLNFVLLAVNQNGADRVEVVIVTAAQRAGPGLSYLEREREREAIIGFV